MSMRILLVGSLTGLGLLLTPASVRPQATNDSPDSGTVANITKTALAVRDSLRNSKIIRVGLSVGFRSVFNKDDLNGRHVSINPKDSTIVVDKIDRKHFVLSGVVTAFPWLGKQSSDRDAPNYARCGALCRLGFLANVTLTAFSPDNVGVFNRSIEGGMGLAWQLGDDFALAATVERVFSRRPLSFVTPGEQLKVDGTVLTTIDISDNRFFVDDHLTAWSIKFVYFF